MADASSKRQTATALSEGVDQRATAGLLALEVMHEIRNPLEALGHLTYLAREEADSPENVRKYMDLAEEQLTILNRIAAQTLGFARLSQSPRFIDLVHLAESALRIHRRTIEAKKIHLVKNLPPELMAEVREGKILQVVSNLIVNALEALPNSGTLTLRLRKRGDKVHIVVADNGHGISPEHGARLFEPFFTTKSDSGNGLGLAISRKIVEEHDGTICFRSSTRHGRNGTSFRVCFPIQSIAKRLT